MSSVLIPPETHTCGTCGSAECECEAALAELDARAGSLARDGFHAAREGRLHHAADRLGEAVRWNAGDAAACAVLGLCRLALGDAPGARAAWRLADTEDCAAWLRSLQDGELRDAFRAYDAALAFAQAGDHPAALAALDRGLAIIPDLVPAARLRGLVLLAQGDASGARAAWSAALAVCRDDPLLLRLLAETPVPPVLPAAPAPVPAAASVAETPRPARAGRGAPFAAGAGTAAVAAGIAAMLAWPSAAPVVSPAPFRDSSVPGGAPFASASASALSAGSTVPAGASPSAGSAGLGSAVSAGSPSPVSASAPSAPSAPSAASASSSVPATGWEAYRVGREAHGRGDWAAAIAALEASVAAGEGRFYHDDALYLLARSLAHAGRTDDARAAAGRLAREHPASPFHNRAVRAIAATGAEPAD